MRRQTTGPTGPTGRIHGPTGRRGTAIVASAAALCLGGGLLTGCGSGPGEGYAAVGAAAEGGPERPSPGGGKPSGGVTFAPLDQPGGMGSGGGDRSGTGPSASSSPGASGPSGLLDGPGGVRTGTAGGEGEPAGAQESGAGDGARTRPGGRTSRPGGGSEARPGPQAPGGSPGEPGSPKPPAPTRPKPDPKPPAPKPDPEPPAAPAALTLSAPQRAAADKRWCEKVTVEFLNTGGSPARSGTVTFATHVIGALGVDWATITSSQPLPTPIRAGATRSETYTVCVASWRVPLGMHIETRNVTAVWE
ncbi:hypothetical protein [Streptomyces californicus]|uniref:hypothetical protein n=1 Tax=Streptomyces californicus TaxID=67351 RepID=UPI0037B9A7D2